MDSIYKKTYKNDRSPLPPASDKMLEGKGGGLAVVDDGA
jgi:hypothetical protein